jgi:hypothetical protein
VSDTPRVDSLIWDRQKYEGPLESYSEFARRLERELNAAAKERDEALALLGFYRTNALEQRRRITELSEERNALKERVFELQDLQNSIGVAIMNFGKQLKRDT